VIASPVRGFTPIMPHRIARTVAAPVTALCLIVGQAAAQPRSIDPVISKGALPADQPLVAVAQGDDLTLRLTSDRPLELRLHGYESLGPSCRARARRVSDRR
jgi:hypothetical protein